MAPARKLRLKVAELVLLLEENILTKLNSHSGLIEAKVQLWQRIREIVKEQHPESKWTYNVQRNEWESHPLQQYITLVELSFPLLDLSPEIKSLTLDEVHEYLIWRGDNHQGVKEWKRYGRPKRENPSKGGDKTQAPPKGTRAYVPGGKKGGGGPIQIEGLKKKGQGGIPP